MDKKLIVILLLVLLAGLGYWWWQQSRIELEPTPATNPFATVEVSNPFEESSNPYENIKTNPFE